MGKTSFALELVKNQHFSKPIKNIYYFGCTGSRNELNWHKILPDVAVTYFDGLPGQSFFHTVKKYSLVVIDDQYEEAINAPHIARAFKYDRRHNKFSIALVTQVKYITPTPETFYLNICFIFCIYKKI